MSAIARASSFPATVQPGLPSLPDLPSGWAREAIGLHLREVRRPVKLQDDQSYRLVTAKRARGGIVSRGTLLGREIAVKSQFWLQDGDFLISKRQIVHGACGLVPKELEGSIVSNEYAVLRCKSGLDDRFLSYLTHSIHFQQTCFHSSIGVHIEKMIFKTEKWLKWDFNLPPIPEQKKIADILSTWDAAIETTGKLLANAEVQKRALMQQLLTGKRRLKGFEGREWKQTSVSAMGKIIGGGTPESEDDTAWNGTINWATPTDITRLDSRYIGSTERKLTEKGLSESAAKLLPSGSLLVCTRATIGEMAIATRPISTNQGFKTIVPNREFNVEFLYHLFSFFKHKLIRYACGSTFLELSKKDFEKLTFFTPDLDEQSRIADLINAFEDKIEVFRRVRLSLQSEKRALMQQLLTGRRRVTI